MFRTRTHAKDAGQVHADFRGKEKPSAFIRVDPRPNGLVVAVLRYTTV
jgi:hypothetical protein